MIKKLIKLIGIFTLITFSFFYTDKVINVIKEEDEIMITLNNIKDNYYQAPKEASIIANTIIPGINGKKINIEASYKKMKEAGSYNQSLIEYENIIPSKSLANNKDKFIIKGNNQKQEISLVFILNNNKYLSKIETILNNKNIIANYFIDYDYLIENSTKIKEMNNREFFSYGNNGIYTQDNLIFSNNLINRISNNKAIYCLSSNMNKDILNICSKNNTYTIVPNIIGNKDSYNLIKNNLTNGSVILLEINNDTINELNIIIDYIKGKGYNIVGLSTLLTEEIT